MEKYIILTLCGIILGVVLYLIVIQLINETETFEEKKEVSSSLSDKVQQVLSSSDEKNRVPIVKKAENNCVEDEELQALKKTDERNIKPISSRLQQFYSIFHKSSYNKSKLWRNISESHTHTHTHAHTGPHKHIQNLSNGSHILFDQSPVGEEHEGILIGNNSLSGPKSYEMGISLTGDFTLFFMIQVIDLPTSGFQLFHTYANVKSNIGISLILFPSKLQVMVGNQEINSKFFNFNESTTYIIIVTKKKDGILDVVVTGKDMTQIIIKNKKVMTIEDFSNKEMVINSAKKGAIRLFCIGMYDVTLNDKSFLVDYLFNEAKKVSPEYKHFEHIQKKHKDEIDKIKMCPFPNEVCSTCQEVKHWDDILYVLTVAKKRCLYAINDYCIKNEDVAKCVCWHKKTPECKNVVSFFNGENHKSKKQNIEIQKLNKKVLTCEEKLLRLNKPSPPPPEQKVLVKETIPYIPRPRTWMEWLFSWA